jgi:hypothetical protein
MALEFRETHRDQSADNQRPDGAEFSAQQAYFIERLARLVRKATLLRRYLVPGDRRMRLLNHAILATYDDCRTLGLVTEARALLAAARHAIPAPAQETPR